MAKIKATTAVERLRTEFPGMSNSVYSMARSPEKYGIRLTPEARRLAGYPTTAEIEQRAKPHRLVCRVSDRVYAQLLTKMKGRTVQEMVEKALMYYYELEDSENDDL